MMAREEFGSGGQAAKPRDGEHLRYIRIYPSMLEMMTQFSSDSVNLRLTSVGLRKTVGTSVKYPAADPSSAR